MGEDTGGTGAVAAGASTNSCGVGARAVTRYRCLRRRSAATKAPKDGRQQPACPANLGIDEYGNYTLLRPRYQGVEVKMATLATRSIRRALAGLLKGTWRAGVGQRDALTATGYS